MILLASTTDKLQLITSAAGQVDVHASWADVSGTTVTVGRTNSRIATATTTDIVAAPAASTSRNIKRYMAANNSGSVSNTVTIQHTDGTNVIPLESFTLAPGERCSYNEVMGLRVFDATGNLKVSVTSAGNTNIADQGPGFAADTYITGSNTQIGARVKQSSYLKWKITASKTAAGTVAAAFNIRVGTAGTVADTARVTHTLAAATAAADAGCFEIDAVFRAVGASATIQSSLKLYHQSAGFTTAGNIFSNVTSSAFALGTADYIGISLNAGTAAAWTIQQVVTDLGNTVA